MIIISFIIPTLLGFLMIYRSLEAFDKISFIQKNGIKTRATVTKIREKKIDDNSYTEDIDGFTINPTINYFYTVSFKDKNGHELERELEYPTTKKPSKIPPFQITIYYLKDETGKIHLIKENMKKNGFYFPLIVGILFLVAVLYNYNGELELILSEIKKILK